MRVARYFFRPIYNRADCTVLVLVAALVGGGHLGLLAAIAALLAGLFAGTLGEMLTFGKIAAPQ